MCGQARKLPEARRGMEETLPHSFQKEPSCQHFDLELLSFSTMRQYILLLKLPCLWHLRQPWQIKAVGETEQTYKEQVKGRLVGTETY